MAAIHLHRFSNLRSRAKQDMHHWVLAAVKARRDAEADTLPTVLAPTWTTPAKKKKPAAGSKRRRGGDIVEDAE